MIEVIILTTNEKGSASVQLVELVKSKKIKINAVVLNEGKITNKKEYYKRKINKILKIGLFGALNGIRMRMVFRWCLKIPGSKLYKRIM